jgi:hypothetical protein
MPISCSIPIFIPVFDVIFRVDFIIICLSIKFIAFVCLDVLKKKPAM